MMTSHPLCQHFRLTVAKKACRFLAGKHSSALSKEEPSRQSMLIQNSFVVTSAYLDRNVAETFDGNGRRLCFANSSIVTNAYLDRNKVETFGSNGKRLCLANSFVVTSVYLDRINPRLLVAAGCAFASST